MIDELLKLLVGEGVAEFTERIGQSSVVPLVVLGVLGMEEVPELVTLLGIVAGDGPHVRELVAQGHDLGIVRGTGQAVDGGLLAGMSAILLTYTLWHGVTLRGYERGNAFAELGADLFYRHVGVLDGVVQGCGGQQFLVGCHRGHDFNSLHRMDDIGETLATTLSPGMGTDSEHDGAVQQCSV